MRDKKTCYNYCNIRFPARRNLGSNWWCRMFQRLMRSTCFLILVVSVISIWIFVAATTHRTMLFKMTGQKETETDEVLVDRFSHGDSIYSGPAILQRGERMIPLLMKLKGKEGLISELGLTDTSSAKAWRIPVQ